MRGWQGDIPRAHAVNPLLLGSSSTLLATLRGGRLHAVQFLWLLAGWARAPLWRQRGLARCSQRQRACADARS